MSRFVSIFVASFFISLHYGAVIYSHSTLLGQYFPTRIVSAFFILGAVGNLLLFLFAPKIIRQAGKKLLLLSSILLAMLSTYVLGAVSVGWIVAFAFVIHASFLFITYYTLDIYLEELSNDRQTGEIRGLYLTLISLGIALGPLVLSLLNRSGDDLSLVYLASATLLIPTFLVSITSIKSSAPKQHGSFHHSPKLPFNLWWQNDDVRHVTLARFILEAFYTFMVIYTPIYLNSIIGFNWSELGVIFTVMLIPFILFEWPAGELADRLWGEKEMMNMGFIIIIASLILMPFIGQSFILWALILFISRVGASLVEIMTESYFFKKIDATDTALISIFRVARPASNILGAAVGILAVNILSFDKIFIVLALMVCYGLKQSFSIADTR